MTAVESETVAGYVPRHAERRRGGLRIVTDYIGRHRDGYRTLKDNERDAMDRILATTLSAHREVNV